MVIPGQHSAHPATSIFGRPGTIYEIDRRFLLFVNSNFQLVPVNLFYIDTLEAK